MSAPPFRPARLVALVAVVALFGALAVRPVHADTQADLNAAEKKLSHLENQIDGETKVLDRIQREANDLAIQIDKVQSELARTQANVVNLQQEVRAATRQLRATQGQLDARAWVAYESGPGSNLEFILGSRSLTDLTDRLEIVNSAAQTDESLIRQLQGERSALQAKQNTLLTLEAKQQVQQAQLKDQQKQVEQKLADEQAALQTLDSDKAQAQDLVTKLKKKRAHEIYLQKLAARLAQQQASGGIGGGGGGGGPSIGGVFQVCPVDQPRARSDDFGAPRYAGGFHLHAGNDILAPLGTPIRAPFNGTATVASNGLGGLAVEVSGALGWDYNAHLSAFGKLGAVSTGDVVGYVGNTGDAAGGPTHDHFEWHPNVIPSPLWTSPYGVSQVGSAIDPYPYLNAVC